MKALLLLLLGVALSGCAVPFVARDGEHSERVRPAAGVIGVSPAAPRSLPPAPSGADRGAPNGTIVGRDGSRIQITVTDEEAAAHE